MAYEKHNYQSGAVLMASELNEMDDAIEALDQETTQLKEDLSESVGDLKSTLEDSGMYGYVTQTLTPSSSVINSEGIAIEGSGFRHVSINVTQGQQYKVSGYKFSGSFPGYIYLKNGSVKSYEQTLSSSSAFTDVAVTIPNDVDTLIVNGSASVEAIVKKYTMQPAELKSDAEQTESEIYTAIDEKVDKYGVEQIAPNNTTFFDNINLFDRINTVLSNKWADEEGKIHAESATTWSLIIPVEPNTKYAIRIPSLNRQIYVESETNDFTIGQTYTKLTHLANTSEWRLLRTGNTAKYIMWYFYNGNYDYDANIDGICQLVADAIPTDQQIPVPTIMHKHLPTDALSGKTAVIYGTSITSDAVYGIPNYIRSITGLTLICESVGSSCARRGWASRETADDPYGWTGTSWQNVFLAMGANLTEKQDLIDNYESKWADLLGGDYEGSSGDGTGTGKPQTLNAEWIAKIKGASYENKLIPYLDGTKDMPDLFIFEHGHNDYEAGMSGLVTNENSLDMSTYGGAMYFYFKKIFEANPQAKIMVLSHYENTSVKGKTIFDAMHELANYHGVAFCNVADALAWSQRLVTTTGYWDQSTHLWVPSGGASQTITRRQQALFDDLHPHNDWSGNASRREASIVSDYMIANKRFLFGT